MPNTKLKQDQKPEYTISNRGVVTVNASTVLKLRKVREQLQAVSRIREAAAGIK